MSIYGPPPNMTVNEALHSVFSHYSTPYKSNMATPSGGLNAAEEEDTSLAPTMDISSFVKIIRDSPGLAKHIGRATVSYLSY